MNFPSDPVWANHSQFGTVRSPRVLILSLSIVFVSALCAAPRSLPEEPRYDDRTPHSLSGRPYAQGRRPLHIYSAHSRPSANYRAFPYSPPGDVPNRGITSPPPQTTVVVLGVLDQYYVSVLRE
ncbi:uncharacterized protein LOC117173612 [Belonocnema kinseyi]|uniref:uncharacterized protein LOC117173612 n=1 Tax=Belonocnema kinseyi TaxID=2817044 RepID=UPI00143D8529|nr:uncharacterized protein LOC117173612 [Belonocnema kinseyi]